MAPILTRLGQSFGFGSAPAPAAPDGPGVPPGIDASGGIISDYTEPGGSIYRSHIFTGSSTFAVDTLSTNPTVPDVIEYLVVAGGGGGGAGFAGAGGAGGVRTNLSGNPYSTSVAFTVAASTNYPVVVGHGAAGGRYNDYGVPGGPSSFGSPTQGIITSRGGGHGGGHENNPMKYGGDGGSAGSGGMETGAGSGGSAVAVTTPSPWPGPSVQGYIGGASVDAGSYPGNSSGGGGGAGGAGGAASPPGAGGTGGIGVQVKISGLSTGTQPMGTPGPSAGGGYFGGGGGGMRGQGGSPNPGGYGGGGAGGVSSAPSPGSAGTFGSSATESTGGGGGASGGAGAPASRGGKGGSGVVIVRYKLAEIGGTAKATGGSISFTPTHTVHTFTSSSTFVLSSPSPTTPAQILVVAGGGGGGNRHGGGGGAGGLIHLPGANGTLANGTYNIIIGGGGRAYPNSATSDSGTDTSFGPPTGVSAPTHLLAKGGGAGGQYPSSSGMSAGGNGGGRSGEPGSGSPGTQPAPTVYGTSTGYGNDGGSGTNYAGDGRLGGGGGGAGGDGSHGGPTAPETGNGGAGLQVMIGNDPDNNYYWAGGGGAGAWNCPDFRTANKGIGGTGGGGGGSSFDPTGGILPAPGGTGGLGDGYAGVWGGPGEPNLNVGGDGATNTGGGGGGNGQSNYGSWPSMGRGGSGGSGIVIVAYPT